MEATFKERCRQALRLTDEALLAECEETFFVGSGPGGQNRNKRATGVRLFHPSTGLFGRATERRSQLQNRSAALDRLKAAMRAATREAKPRRPTTPTRGSKERRLAQKRLKTEKKTQRQKIW